MALGAAGCGADTNGEMRCGYLNANGDGTFTCGKYCLSLKSATNGEPFRTKACSRDAWKAREMPIVIHHMEAFTK